MKMRNILLYFIVIRFTESRSPLRIIGGRDAADEYPYVVSIEMHLNISKNENNKTISRHPFCTGSVMTPVWTISAAHCFGFTVPTKGNITSIAKLRAQLGEEYSIVIGHGRMNTTISYVNAFSRVEYFVKHHAYSNLIFKYDVRTSNDVSLVRHQHLPLKQYVKVAGLDFNSLIGHEVTLAGYGLTHDTQGDIHSTFVIQKPLQVLTGVVVQCPRNKMLYPGLCIAGRCGQVESTCSGDSGGPVLHPAGIVGVISKGKLCLPVTDAIPVDVVSFATALSPYIQWIIDNIRNN